MGGTDVSGIQPADDESLAGLLRRAFGPGAFPERLARRGRWLSARCMIQIGDVFLFVQIEHGIPRLVESVPPLAVWEFAIRGTTAAWRDHWENPPRPGRHDIMALTKSGDMRLEGNLQPLLANLQYVKDLLALPRLGGKT